MKLWKKSVLFYIGGMLYTALELLWRGRSHCRMFLLGGGCFLVLGKVGRLRLPLFWRAALGSLCITAGELATGLLLNRHFTIWDYRARAFHLWGQICPLYSLFWLLLSPVGWWVYGKIEAKLKK